MKILVTGGVGFVGTNLIKRLLNDGHDVTSLDNYSTGKKENEQEGCTYIDVDISNQSTLEAKLYWAYKDEKPDIIYHMAALARIQPSIKNPVKSVGNNFNSTLNVLDWAKTNKNIAVVFAGSSSFHHGLWGSPYAWSKHAGEQLCKLYDNVYNLPVATCRFYNVYGPNQLEDGAYATVLGIFMKQYREGKPLTITGDGKQRRDFTHVDDIVDGLVKCGNSLLIPNAYNAKVSGEIFELGRGENHSVNEVAEMFGGNYPTKYIPARKGEYDVTLADYSKAQKMLGWKPFIDLKDYVNEIC